jgi:hypothetical protein
VNLWLNSLVAAGRAALLAPFCGYFIAVHSADSSVYLKSGSGREFAKRHFG